MAVKHQFTGKLLRITSDKADLNRKMLAWNKAFLEVNKTLGGQGGKEKNKG